MGAENLTADELVVEAEYFHSTGQEEPSLGNLHKNLQIVMRMEGYVPVNPQKTMLAPNSIRYIRNPGSPNKSWLWKLKEKLGWADEEQLMNETYLDRLDGLRDDDVFRFRFRMFPVELEEEMGICIEADAEPVVYHKHEQIERQQDYNAQNVVGGCKERLKDISTEMGWGIWQEPHTTAENLRETVNNEIRKEINGTKYGSDVIQLADEGDEALRYQLLHSALGSYIHAIEWTIICYFEDEVGEDLIEEEIDEGFGYNYKQLVEMLSNEGVATQKTQDDLDDLKTYRLWMGHHKSGPLTEANVNRVKERLRILLEELFL